MSEPRPIQSLSSYSLLGRSGLRVSPLCLGTMTFGTEWGWGSDEATARAILMRYLEAGGNFVDTADAYTNGHSEEMLGKFLEESGERERVVLATKFTFSTKQGDPNAGGNGRKHLRAALEASLRRLRTDHVDLYWLHNWDTLTPIEEVMSTLDDLVRAGKVRYIGLSDTPAWYAARAQTLAELRGQERVCGLQLEYSLVERNIEREYVPMAQQLGMGVCCWSPLASGLLTGKYLSRDDLRKSKGRLAALVDSGNPGFDKLYTDRNFALARELVEVARAVDRPPAQVALGWITRRPGVVSTLIGATRLEQLEENLHALEHELPPGLSRRLEEASRPEPQFPYMFHGGKMQSLVNSGCRVAAEPSWYR